jgi:hypothetical protein
MPDGKSADTIGVTQNSRINPLAWPPINRHIAALVAMKTKVPQLSKLNLL